METLTSEQAFYDWIEKERVIIYVSADWCPDCRVIEPVLPEIENNYSTYTFVYMNRDEFIDLCATYDIFGIPSFIAFHHGEETDRFVSKDRKTKEEIEVFLDKCF
ncbi:thiol-disulfide isomerase and thioredoxin [Gracilibacillus halophilus YIM-C55.5]|uniref:Thiol-disulfide isomerase and thioredoxin n=1 Tax=Gracilibacillus halophilus YIM-C55.5 TaxID=1308866 RepID=N4W977_9BACI|nr:thioredoxin family protein [Gracilibacillus halophilus]ENH95794.1 thiol-disulfide isomerase and thioredoxin [Gracilibacillus halophilus YIM-C55.5]